MSWVFLTPTSAYKLKKPVCNAFLDFRTPRARHFFCEEEVRLNRRLAPGVYRGVLPLYRDGFGVLHLGPGGEPMDWLVHMQRLPAALMLDQLLQNGSASVYHLQRVAQRLYDFYGAQPPVAISPDVYVQRFFSGVDASEQALCEPGMGLSSREVRLVCAQQRQVLSQCAPGLAARVRAGQVVEGHGDLRPEHIYLGEPLAIIDCLEFCRDLRLLDTADELGFLALECEMAGAPGLGRALLDAYNRLAGNGPAHPQLAAITHFYQSFRACTRARLAILHLAEARYQGSPKWVLRARRYLHAAWQHVRASQRALAEPTAVEGAS